MTLKPCKDCGIRPKAMGRTRCYPCYRKARQLPRYAPSTALKTLYLDIETSPNLGFVWGQWQQNLTLDQLTDFAEMLCFSAKWAGEDEPVQFFRGPEMVLAAHRLLSEADVVVHFYGSKFDIPHLNREFLQAGLGPANPFKQVDLKLEVAKHFKFTSNKLQHVAEALGLGGKEDNSGWKTWIQCMLGVEEAWTEMRTYNERDVTLLEELHQILLPWLSTQPNAFLYGSDGDGCTKCDGDLETDGYYRTKLSVFQQYKCLACGHRMRDSKRLFGTHIQDAVL